MFTAKHSGVSNPSLNHSCRVFRFVKITFVDSSGFVLSEVFYDLDRI